MLVHLLLMLSTQTRESHSKAASTLLLNARTPSVSTLPLDAYRRSGVNATRRRDPPDMDRYAMDPSPMRLSKKYVTRVVHHSVLGVAALPLAASSTTGAFQSRTLAMDRQGKLELNSHVLWPVDKAPSVDWKCSSGWMYPCVVSARMRRMHRRAA